MEGYGGLVNLWDPESVDSDIIGALLESTEGELTAQLWSELIDMFGHVNVRLVPADSKLTHVSAGEQVVWLGSGVVIRHSKVYTATIPFGVFEMEYEDSKLELTVQSNVYDFCAALDALYDKLFWSWNGDWNWEFEICVIELVIAVEDHIAPYIGMMKQLLSVMGKGDSIQQMLEMLQKDLGSKTWYSVCRLHQNLYQLLEYRGMMPGFPEECVNAIRNFEQCKLRNSSFLEFEHALGTLLEATLGYEEHLGESDTNSCASLIKQACSDALTSELSDISSLWKVRQSLTMSSMFSPQAVSSTRTAVMFPAISMELFDSSRQDDLDSQVLDLSERLCGGVVMFGGMMTLQMGKDAVYEASVIQSALNSGIAYVSSDGGLIGLMSSKSASLDLSKPICSKAIWKRVKDAKRIIRNVLKGRNVSLRINTDFDLVIEKLKAHHDTSWVDDKLLTVWKHMWDHNQLIVFELWLDDTLIAADIGHPVAGGASFYVATRFFDAEYRKFQPGFLLAFSEVFALKNIFGVGMWDLGGYDGNPQMAYKALVSDILDRPQALHRFKTSRSKHNTTAKFIPGILIESMTQDHLISVSKP